MFYKALDHVAKIALGHIHFLPTLSLKIQTGNPVPYFVFCRKLQGISFSKLTYYPKCLRQMHTGGKHSAANTAHDLHQRSIILSTNQVNHSVNQSIKMRHTMTIYCPIPISIPCHIQTKNSRDVITTYTPVHPPPPLLHENLQRVNVPTAPLTSLTCTTCFTRSSSHISTFLIL